jgi:hypothetical protein
VWTTTGVVLTVGFLEGQVSGLSPDGEWQRSFQPLTSVRILIISSRTEAKVPRWMTWRSMIPNQISTRLSHDPDVGVKWTWMRKFAAMVSKASPGPPGRRRPMRTRTPQCAFIHRAVPNARCPCRSWVVEIVLSELAAASFAVEAHDEAVLVGADDGPRGRSRYRDVPVATTASLSTAT